MELASPLSYIRTEELGPRLIVQSTYICRGGDGSEKNRSVEFQVPNMQVIYERMDFRYAYDTRYGG